MKHGWIEERKGARGISFRVRFWAPNADGVTVAKSRSYGAWTYGTKSKAESAAKAFLAEQVTKVRDGSYITPSTLTFAELVDMWLDSRDIEGKITSNTLGNYRSARRHLDAEAAAIPLQQLRSLHIQALYGRLRKAEIGPKTLQILDVVIRASLSQAVRWELIGRNPASAVRAPITEAKPIRYWTPEQAQHFLTVGCGDPVYGLAWRVALLTGMRAGELFALRWSDLDFDRKTISIHRTITKEGSRRFVVGERPKSPNSRRTIPMPDSCVDLLRHHRTRQLERRLQAGGNWETAHGDLVFDRGRGALAHSTFYRKAWARALRTVPDLPRITPHGLRHSVATAMLIQGIHPKVVAELLGDTVATVLKVYSHVTVETKIDAARALDAMFATPVPANTTTSTG